MGRSTVVSGFGAELVTRSREAAEHLASPRPTPSDRALYDQGRRPVVVPLRQDDLATMVGTTRPTANRVLQQLVDDGLVTLGRGRIEIDDLDALAARAG